MNDKRLFTKPIVGLCCLRSLHYFIEYQTLLALSALWSRNVSRSKRYTLESLRRLQREVVALFETDVQNILNSDLPPRLLWTESPLLHLKRVPKIVRDGLHLSTRRKKHETHEFNDEAEQHLNEVPEYYRRNFHFQTDGYLSEHSAEIYDHQVELLFAGAADAMRRIILPDLNAAIDKQTKLKFLELGCGTGSMTKNIRLAFSNAHIVATDLSEPYLEVARRRLKNLPRSTAIEFQRADAAHLPYEDSTFDMVYSVFLFHELPRDVRMQALREAHRVLKPGGIFAYVDSLQLGDKPDFDDVLKNFPRDFHEPFYRDYIETPVQSLAASAGFRHFSTRHGFLAKGEVFRKNFNSQDSNG